MKIILISKNCYPKLGPRAHRATELAKELARRGHKVILYALLGDYDYETFQRETRVIVKNLGTSKYGVPDNTGFYAKSFVKKGLRKVLHKPLEFPQIELTAMVQKALAQEGDIDYLITVAHPHTIHWGAARYVEKYNRRIKFWVADCGDPFMKNPFDFHPFYFKPIEKKWGKLCDYITVPIEEARSGYYQEFKDKIKVIPQGFNFEDIRLAQYQKNKIPTFAYSGRVYPGKRDPTNFLNYLIQLDIDFKLIIYTPQKKFYKPFQEELGNKLELKPYIPRERLIYELSKMDFLINVKNISAVQSPSKLIDYGLTKRPTLGITTEFNEQQNLNQFLEGDYRGQLILDNFDQYNIKNVAKHFLDLTS